LKIAFTVAQIKKELKKRIILNKILSGGKYKAVLLLEIFSSELEVISL